MEKSLLRVALALLIIGSATPSFAQKTETGEAQALAALKMLPDDFMWRNSEYRADSYIRAAVALQKLGKEGAIKVLKAFLKKNPASTGAMPLCRMLFMAKPGKEFRGAYIGGVSLVGKRRQGAPPLGEIVEIVDGVPFLVIRGLLLAGRPEFGAEYLDYCIASCDWNTVRFQPVSREQKRKALAKFIGSAAWERPLEDEGKAFLESQIKDSEEDAQNTERKNLFNTLPQFKAGRDYYDYNVEPYLQMAISLQKMDEKRRREFLLQLAEDRLYNQTPVILCRMLFTAKPGQAFRLPNIGAARLIGCKQNGEGALAERRVKAWKSAPIEIVDGVPLLIANAWSDVKEPETAYNYLVYCLSSCDWSTTRYQPVSAEAKRRAVEKLMRSPKWERPLSDKETQFLLRQIK